MSQRLVTVFAGALWEAHALQGRLAQEDVPAFIPDATVKTMGPFFTRANMLEVGLRVPEDRPERAAQIAARWQETSRSKAAEPSIQDELADLDRRAPRRENRLPRVPSPRWSNVHGETGKRRRPAEESWMRCALRTALIAILLSAGPATAAAQNRDHPGLVHLGDGEWGTREQALEAGLIEYRGRWLPKKLEKSLAKWERLDAKGLAWDDAYKERTKYYRVKTNVPRFVFELEIAPFLDALGDTYTRVFQEDFGLKGKAVKNKDLKIYGSFEDYSFHEPRGGSDRPRTNPGFIINGAELVVFYEESDPARFYATVFHEGAHQFFLSLLPGADLPIWLDEALATWFEGATYSRATKEITFGGIPGDRLLVAQRLLASTPGTPGELFMNVPQPSFDANHYALAWSFLHYLLKRTGDDNTKKFARFLDEANGSGTRPIPEVFTKATGEDFAQLARGWRAHVEALEPPAESLQWVTLAVESAAGEDVREGDTIWSVDGHEIYHSSRFVTLWRARPKDRPLELIVIRSEPAFEHPFAQRTQMRVKIAPDSELALRPSRGFARQASLRD
jgi:hypothetical protein